MKKSKTMRVASGLLVLTLLSTCMVAGTFAKYTTSADGSDTARVAKFGVTVTANSDTMFEKKYATDDTAAKQASIDNSVTATENVIAPGTKGEMTKVALSGTPEVAVKVSYDGTLTLGDGWTVEGSYYCPLKITVNDETISGLDYASADEFESAVKAKIAAYSKSYAPGTNLGVNSEGTTPQNDRLAISWAWDYADATGQKANQDNTKDTALGDAAKATVKLDVTTTVTQID